MAKAHRHIRVEQVKKGWVALCTCGYKTPPQPSFAHAFGYACLHGRTEEIPALKIGVPT